jgi:predicted flavoprotein YhiN
MYSSEIAWEKFGSNSPKSIHLAPLADMDEKMWNTFFIEQFSLHPKKTITTVLSEKLPRRFVEGFVREYCSHITDTYLSSVSKADRLNISELLGV